MKMQLTEQRSASPARTGSPSDPSRLQRRNSSKWKQEQVLKEKADKEKEDEQKVKKQEKVQEVVRRASGSNPSIALGKSPVSPQPAATTTVVLKKVCASCKQNLPQENFTSAQLKKLNAAKCKSCVEKQQ